MKYINPITFLQPEIVAANSIADKRSLLLHKKRLLAEIELSEDKTVLVNDSVLTKNDLLNLFEELQSGEIEFHLAIARDRWLSAFLEDNGSSSGNGIVNTEIYNNPAFIKFIAPYFEEIFTKKVLENFKNGDVGRMGVLFKNPLLLDGEHQEKSYGKIMRYLVQKQNQLLQIKDDAVNRKKAAAKDFETFTGESFIALLNRLPDEFNEFRSGYGIELINTGIALQKINLKLAVKILGSVQLLKTDDYTQEQNDERYEILEKNLKAKPSVNWRWGWLIFILFRIIYSANSCNKHDTNINNIDYYSTYDIDKVKIDAGQVFFRDKHKMGTQFINALSNYSGDPSNFKNAGLYETAVLKSGTDVYKKLFREAPFKAENDGGGIVIPGYDDEKFKASQKAQLYQENVLVENKTDAEAIAIVQTSDSVFTSYVKANDTASFFVSNGVNAVYFYLGNNWDEKKTLKQQLISNGDSLHALKLEGVFRSITPVTVKYLNEPFWLTVNNNTSSTKDRRSFFTIKVQDKYPFVDFETLSVDRVKMDRGYFRY